MFLLLYHRSFKYFFYIILQQCILQAAFPTYGLFALLFRDFLVWCDHNYLFFLLWCALGIDQNNHCQSKCQIAFPLWFLATSWFKLSCLVIKPFWNDFVYGVRKGPNFILLHVDSQVSQYHFFKKLSFSPLLIHSSLVDN